MPKRTMKPVNKTHAKAIRKKAEPFMLLDSDPAADFEDLKDRTEKRNSRGKPKKVLTNTKVFARLRLVNKAKRKDDKMATDKQKTTNKTNKGDIIKSVAWLVEAAFRAFVGWVLLSNFDHLVTTAAAFYALGTAGVIVVTHFVNAHK